MRVPAFFVPLILPAVACWAIRERHFILRHGTPLTAHETALAREMGVKNPEAIRLFPFEAIPARMGKSIYLLGRKLGVFLPQISGLTLGHAIYIRRECWGDRHLLAHEFVHTGQFERLGLRGFLRRYLTECIKLGYQHSPLEREAVEKSARYG